VKKAVSVTIGSIIIMTVFGMDNLVTSSLATAAHATTSKEDYIVLGMGCFWGAEKRMAEIPGV